MTTSTQITFDNFISGVNEEQYMFELLTTNQKFIEEIKLDNLKVGRDNSLFVKTITGKYSSPEFTKFLLELGCNPCDTLHGESITLHLIQNNTFKSDTPKNCDEILKLLLEYMPPEEIQKLITNKIMSFSTQLLIDSQDFQNTFKWMVDNKYLTADNCLKENIDFPPSLFYLENKPENTYEKLSRAKTLELSPQFFKTFGGRGYKKTINFFAKQNLTEEQKEIIFSVASKNITTAARIGPLIELYQALNIKNKTKYYLHPAFNNESKNKIGEFFKKTIDYKTYSISDNNYFYLKLLNNSEYISLTTSFQHDRNNKKFNFLGEKNDINPRETQAEHIFDILYTEQNFLETMKIGRTLLDLVANSEAGITREQLKETDFISNLIFKIADDSRKGTPADTKALENAETFCYEIMLQYKLNTDTQINILILLNNAFKAANQSSNPKHFSDKTISITCDILRELDKNNELHKVDLLIGPLYFLQHIEPEIYTEYEQKKLNSIIKESNNKKNITKI